MLSINQAVIKMLQEAGFGVFGETLFFGRVPDSKKTTTELWWVVPQPSNTSRHNVTGEDALRCPFTLYYRSMSSRDVDEKIFQASQFFVSAHCYNLDSFQTMDVEIRSTQEGVETDPENRVVGSMGFTVTVYDIAN